ncbi:MAG: hypothetical protein U0441_28045 [Polyangiaceae bacterium]
MLSRVDVSASGKAPRGRVERLALGAAGLGAAALALATTGGCSTLIGYDDIAYEKGDTTDSSGARTSACVPSEAAGPVDDACGAFVSAVNGDDAKGDGTKSRPFHTIARALKMSNTVYACNGATVEEALELDGDVAVFGGLDCMSGWAYAPKTRTEWHAPAGQIPVRVAELARLSLRDLEIVAPDAAEASGSSIGVLAGADSTLDLRRCTVKAGRGADGMPPPLPASAGMIGAPGQQGSDGCDANVPSTAPGLGGQGLCDDTDVSGGAGGPGLPGPSGADGSDGSPTPGAGDPGHGGKKQDATKCEAGHPGEKGAMGADGGGGQSVGSISKDGYTGSSGDDGARGGPGQGGGGGGGARSCWNAKAGPAGGGGGSGGCGGDGGKGGSPGGASIGVLSLNAKLIASELLVVVAEGGAGGDGAQGGPGGMGGLAGNAGSGDPAAQACTGGKGGDGGKGGRGGGGGGGPSIGIAYRGVAPPTMGVEIVVGVGGKGGKGAGSANDGAPGAAAKTMLMN